MKTLTPQTLSCLEFRREKLATPRELSPAARQHEHDCALCHAWAQRINTVEARISEEMLAIPVPEGLNERILLRSFTGKRQPLYRRPWAIAASVLFAGVIGLGMWQFTRYEAGQDLAFAAALHAIEEPAELALHRSEPPAKFGMILASFGGKLQAPLGEVSYIHFCPIEGFGQGWHIIYNTPQGKVTLLLVPAKPGAARVQTVQVAGKSVKVERSGQGYYAIIADDMPALDAADSQIKRAVRWDT
jgi:hypothetical protein